ncbi:ATP-binding protein [Aeromicrobium camelliae]|uniref:ATP-binding protein n=2 Tax=Aeromicrobium TaxID=2040 RepID=A0A3N6WJU4_9ACTN|nr:ATP-binding protein [Aeromicrobium camelliae]RQN02055.1 ATP-binding protein [Aeromicrobium camelliae]
MSDALFENLFAALDASPDQHDLRLQVARLLEEHGRRAEAAEHASLVLRARPDDAAALELLVRCTTDTAAAAAPSSAEQPAAARSGEFDWSRAEQQLGNDLPPPFVEEPVKVGGEGTPTVDVEDAAVTLDDVGGLESVKRRLHEAFLDPLRNPEIAQAFGASLRGGLLLYGPPGCGKTFIARAVAGELGLRFLTASIADVMGEHFGQTEKNLQKLFASARSYAPIVMFLDEIDALGARRSSIGTGWSGMRAIVNQLLLELDSVKDDNEGLFLLAASNQPWEVDPALLRPGRLDRLVLVLPPDGPARETILRGLFLKRPIAGIDLASIVARTEDFSGADLAHLVDTAAQKALNRSLAQGEIQPLQMHDVEDALAEIKPSTLSWFHGARNVVEFANKDGRYDDLADELKRRHIL